MGAVLALVVQHRRPDTMSNYQLRLSQRFPHANFARNAAHNSLRSLANKGFVRLVHQGVEPAEDRYEATPKGVMWCRRWVRGAANGLPEVRDTVRGRLGFSAADDLSALISSLQAEEDACAHEYAKAHGRKLTARSSPVAEEKQDYNIKIGRIMLTDEAACWAEMTKRRMRLRIQLEEIRDQLQGAPSDRESDDV
ncbi:MAG: hypothetical protein ABSH36_17210 [Solirubrobacteraceae bacterium]